ncbi:MAG TPA: PAS domain S-box protein, partial [Thiotrichales bacterium]|nr:PAS domain S-box protein [Thiotrichales bacterium]
LDNKQKLVLVNRALADFLGVDADDVRGKALNHLYDVDTAKQLLAIKCDDGDVRNRELRLEINGRRYDYHVSIVTLKHEKYQHSHLYVLHDITDLKDAQGRHNRMMDAIIQTLVRLTDIHDPHCANHSERTREVAVAIARAMDLPQPRLNALAMAAQLANIGKLYVPADILTRTGPLSEEESAILRKNNQYSVDILQELKFDGPVIDFVKQKNEYLDGSGYPLGIAGEEILLESRILAVANAFVAMSSARAYRPGKPLKDVLDTLFEQADVRYDRQVIAALLYVAENRADWRNWQNIE